MKNRMLSVLVIICLVVTMLAPAGMKPHEALAESSFTVRTSMPTLQDQNAKYYYSDLNRFWKAGRLAPDFKYYEGIMDDGKQGGYIWGNCTWWVYGRASEVLGTPLNPELKGNAGTWYDCNKKGNYYPYGQTAKVGAIVVYSSHVAFVEKIENGQIYVSESGWQTKTYGPKSTDDFYFHYGTPWRSKETPKGYIYITEKVSVDPSIKPANYSVDVPYSDLRMRTGPGTGYENKGYVTKGIHKIKAVTTDGLWGQLEENGYWIFLEYTQAVVAKSSNNNLKALSVTGYNLSPAFSADKTAYTVTVSNDTTSIVIAAVKADSKSIVAGVGTKTPVVGTNTYNISVTAENGSVKTYTVNVIREAEKKVSVNIDSLNMRTGPSTSYKSKGKIKPGTYTVVRTKNGWGKLKENGYWISLKYTVAPGSSTTNNTSASSVTSTYKVKITVSSLNMRIGPSTSYKSKGKIKKGTYTIIKTKNGWGKLKKNGYWINLKYAKKVTSSSYKVKVKVSSLNMRTGPSTSYKSKGKIKKGTYTITKTKNGWGKLKKNGYWIKLSYTKRV